MKKNTIHEELFRIHELTYGKKYLTENSDNFINKILKILGIDNLDLGKIKTEKTDVLTNNIDDFYETLNDSIVLGGISQNDETTEDGKKKIEALQVGLQLLGYELKENGVNGKLNDETKNAIKKFMEDNSIKLKESFLRISQNLLSEIKFVNFKDVSYNNLRFAKKVLNDKINKSLLDDLDKAGELAGVTVSITTAKSGHGVKTKTGNISRHSKETAVDIGILNGVSGKGATNGNNGNPEFRKLGNKLKDALVSLGYVWNTERGNQKSVLWQTTLGGNHYNHLHVSNNGDPSEVKTPIEKKDSDNKTILPVIATTEVLKKLIELLKQKNITSTDLSIFTGKKDEVSMVNTDEDFYKSILKCVGAPESEENMKFMYAWRQSEGGKYKNNPFNTKREYPNATGSGIKNYQTREDGVNATCETLKLNYYTCIVDGLKNDIGAKEISQKCDSALKTWGTHQTNPLITQVLNGYESGNEMKPNPIS